MVVVKHLTTACNRKLNPNFRAFAGRRRSGALSVSPRCCLWWLRGTCLCLAGRRCSRTEVRSLRLCARIWQLWVSKCSRQSHFWAWLRHLSFTWSSWVWVSKDVSCSWLRVSYLFRLIHFLLHRRLHHLLSHVYLQANQSYQQVSSRIISQDWSFCLLYLSCQPLPNPSSRYVLRECWLSAQFYVYSQRFMIIGPVLLSGLLDGHCHDVVAGKRRLVRGLPKCELVLHLFGRYCRLYDSSR